VPSKNPLLIEAFGQSKTIREWSEDPRCPVGQHALRTRLVKLGWETERAITEPQHEHLYEAFGVRKRLLQWCRDPRCRASFRNLLSRIEAGWDFEKCLTMPERNTVYAKPRKEPVQRLPSGREACFTALGETKSLKDWSKDPRCAVRYLRLRDRLIKGWALEDALTVPVDGGNPRPTQPIRASSVPIHPKRDLFAAFGERKTLAEWANDSRCHVSLRTLRARVANGLPFKLALKPKKMTPSPGGARTYQAFGEIKTVREWADDPRCAVSVTHLAKRLANGAPLEEALVQPVHVPPELGAFGERKRVCDWVRDPRCRVTYHQLASRLDKGWTLERALVTDPRPPRGGQKETANGSPAGR